MEQFIIDNREFIESPNIVLILLLIINIACSVYLSNPTLLMLLIKNILIIIQIIQLFLIVYLVNS